MTCLAIWVHPHCNKLPCKAEGSLSQMMLKHTLGGHLSETLHKRVLTGAHRKRDGTEWLLKAFSTPKCYVSRTYSSEQRSKLTMYQDHNGRDGEAEDRSPQEWAGKRLGQTLPNSAKIHCEKNKNYGQPKSHFTYRMPHNQLYSGDFFFSLWVDFISQNGQAIFLVV